MNIKRDRRRTRRQTAISTLPSLMTLGNLLCGCASIFYASRSFDGTETYLFHQWTPLTVAAAMIFFGMVFDGLDGYVARITRFTSEFGAQLDSMADMVTFGVAPAFLVVQLVNIGTPFFGESHPKWSIFFDRTVLIIAGVYVACTALRLARFNSEMEGDDAASHTYFRGLPSPGAAGTIAGLTLLHEYLLEHGSSHPLTAYFTAITMITVAFVAALAMVSPLRYSHVINRFLRDRATFSYVVLIVIAGLLLWIIPQWSIAGGFVIYALSAPVARLFGRSGRKNNGSSDNDNNINNDTDINNDFDNDDDSNNNDDSDSNDDDDNNAADSVNADNINPN